MVWFWLLIGGIGTVGGAGALVVAFRAGQEGDRAKERVLFRRAVVGLAIGSLAFLAAMVAGTPRG
ncbi:hypothetical protein [Actinotalea sp.]|uniref:hypothetical protein n=1 Tax=Actinotalea sp. TaxID=1872145 RepID=UPI0035693B7A